LGLRRAMSSSLSRGSIGRIAMCSKSIRGRPGEPITGVFATRSPHRPNPLGFHRVTVREMSEGRLRIGPLEAIDGTPVVDIKPVLADWTEG
jgi:tRNA (Thr-GGU) A37 N-methylase